MEKEVKNRFKLLLFGNRTNTLAVIITKVEKSFMILQSLVAIAFALSITSTAAFAQLGPKDGANLAPTDLERVKVGQPAPDFTLENIDGKHVSLSEFRGKKNVVLVFYRGQWWPYCTQQLGELKDLLTTQEKEKVQILTVSIDSHDDSKKFIQKLQDKFPGNYDFPFLEDKNHKVIDRYGILNPDGKGWPHPATYVVDTQGIVRWKFVEVNYRKRPSNEQILAELKKNR
jgi:peroxiredoxin